MKCLNLVVTEKIKFPCKVFLRIAIVIKFNNYDSQYKFPDPSGLEKRIIHSRSIQVIKMDSITGLDISRPSKVTKMDWEAG